MGENEAEPRPSTGRRSRRCWRFGTVVFDEASWSLTVDGEEVAIESRPLELLHELCLRAGEVVSKDELLETVWGGITVVENSIPTAIAKLRRALGPHADAIVTVPRIGYRLAAAVETQIMAPAPRFAFTAGDAVPGREQWRLVAPLGDGGADDVWRGRHEKTGETRVFKFADAPDRLRALRREAALSRLLLAALGPDGPFVPLIEWNFVTAPYFIESREAGLSLLDWARAAGGLAAIPLETRIAVAAQLARAVAAVHAVGVLHKDIKPANILVEQPGDGFRIRLADFGSGRVVEGDIPSPYAITDLDAAGMAGSSEDDRLSGTPYYRAPEIAAGAVPTVSSDIYSVGLVLFQLTVGDFGRAPAPGWEREIADPLLCQDIADAAAGDPAARIGSAAILADRLDALAERRARMRAEAEAAARLEELDRAEARRAARRPWMRAAAASALIGIVATSGAAIHALAQRDAARQQERIARASYDFLADDLLARSDPFRTGTADETVTAALLRAGGEIDRRFAMAPLVAGRLHHSMARAFDQRSDVGSARTEYARADRNFARAGEDAVRDRRLSRSHWAQLEALSGDATRLPLARRLLDTSRAGADTGDRELAVWFHSAEGAVALAGEDVRAAQQAFTRASALAEQQPDLFDLRQRLNLRQRIAFTYIRLGDGETAERLFRPLLAEFTTLQGAGHPDTLNIRLNVMQALLVQRKHAEVVDIATGLLPDMERALGRDHRRTLQVLAVRQQALGILERYAEAAQDGERVWRAAAAHEGPRAFQAVAARADTAETQCRAGDYPAGLANGRAALAAARTPGQPETALAMAIRTTIAGCLILADRAREAEPLLAGIDRARVSELVGDARWDANLDLALAAVMAAKRDLAAARRHLDAATRRLGDTAEPFQQRRIARLSAILA